MRSKRRRVVGIAMAMSVAVGVTGCTPEQTATWQAYLDRQVTAPVPAPALSGPALRLAWSDEFSQATVDSRRWSHREPWNNPPGFRNDSEGWLPFPATAANLSVSNGAASIRAVRDQVAINSGKVMTTAMLTSRDKYNSFTHGVVEARMRIPTGKGLWPQFWLLGNGTAHDGWPKTGEIDIFEFANNASGGAGRMYSSVHWGDVTNGSITAHHTASKSAAPSWWGDGEFHTFTLHRTADFLRFYIDGVQVMQLLPGETVRDYPTAVPKDGVLFKSPMHIRFGLEVGGPWAGQGLSPGQYEPGEMVIDYVRAWSS